MNNEQLKWLVAFENGCYCEICNHGYWIKQVISTKIVPSTLVLYHIDGDNVNNNFDNISLRCIYCAKSRRISRKILMKNHKIEILGGLNGLQGKVWITNDIINKFMDKDEAQIFIDNMGWRRGRIGTTTPPSPAGCRIISNGFITKRIKKTGKLPPEGWWYVSRMPPRVKKKSGDFYKKSDDSCAPEQ